MGVLPSSSDLQFLSISQLNRTGWEAFCLATFALSLIVWTNKGGDIIDLIKWITLCGFFSDEQALKGENLLLALIALN